MSPCRADHLSNSICRACHSGDIKTHLKVAGVLPSVRQQTFTFTEEPLQEALSLCGCWYNVFKLQMEFLGFMACCGASRAEFCT